MGLRIIAYPAFRDAAGGDGFAADCLVSQGVGLKSLRICSFLARRNSLRNFRALATRRRHRRQPETPNPGCGAQTAAGSLEAVFESSDVERFGWILMEV